MSPKHSRFHPQTSAFKSQERSERAEGIVETIVAEAEELLSQRFGGSQKLSDIVELNGSGAAVVLRARVANSPFLQQRSVVIKHVPHTGMLYDESTLMREIVAYQFTTSLSEDVRPGPVLLAQDVEKHLLIISDSGDGDTFAELLDTNNEDTRISILRNLGEALGKMHADTASKEQDFQILLKRMLNKHPEVVPMYEFRERALLRSITMGADILSHMGFEVPEVVVEFANDATRRLKSGRHRAFTPFDLSPDNIIVAERTHFLDYEWAGFRDVAFDLACVIAGFPQYLSSHPITDVEADVFVEAWVQEVNKVWPRANNSDSLARRIVTAMVGWSLSSLAIMLVGMGAETTEDFIERAYSEKDFDHHALLEGLEPIAREIFGYDEPSIEGIDLVRAELHETFEALQRYCARGRDPRFAQVAEFAATTMKALGNPTINE